MQFLWPVSIDKNTAGNAWFLLIMCTLLPFAYVWIPDTRWIFADAMQCQVSDSRTGTEGQTLKFNAVLEQSINYGMSDLLAAGTTFRALLKTELQLHKHSMCRFRLSHRKLSTCSPVRFSEMRLLSRAVNPVRLFTVIFGTRPMFRCWRPEHIWIWRHAEMYKDLLFHMLNHV